MTHPRPATYQHLTVHQVDITKFILHGWVDPLEICFSDFGEPSMGSQLSQGLLPHASCRACWWGNLKAINAAHVIYL